MSRCPGPLVSWRGYFISGGVLASAGWCAGSLPAARQGRAHGAGTAQPSAQEAWHPELQNFRDGIRGPPPQAARPRGWGSRGIQRWLPPGAAPPTAAWQLALLWGDTPSTPAPTGTPAPAALPAPRGARRAAHWFSLFLLYKLPVGIHLFVPLLGLAAGRTLKEDKVSFGPTHRPLHLHHLFSPALH